VEANIVHIASDFIVHCEPSLQGTLLGDKAVSAIFDNSKIKRFVPGYVATIPFHQGIRRTLAWFEADPARMRIVDRSNQTIDRILAAYQKAF
jgi:ribosome biogenesis protein Tsr3